MNASLLFTILRYPQVFRPSHSLKQASSHCQVEKNRKKGSLTVNNGLDTFLYSTPKPKKGFHALGTN